MMGHTATIRAKNVRRTRCSWRNRTDLITGAQRQIEMRFPSNFCGRQSMTKIKYFAAALVFTACAGNVPANNANAINTVKKTTPGAPTKDALMTLEKSAYE